MKRKIIAILFVLGIMVSGKVEAHSGFELHKADFYAVLGFEENAKVTAWMRQISSKMIDGYRGVELPEYNGLNFYDYLKAEFPGFKCKHRLLFHWGYNSSPWNDKLQAKADALKWDAAELQRFKNALIKEQKRRNFEANAMTEQLFGFASGGRDASYANAMISIVYDVHLLGDYTPDNKDFDGVQDFGAVVGDLINSVRKLDDKRSKELIRKIRAASLATDKSVNIRAENIIAILSDEFPRFLKSARDGSLARRFQARGISFRL